MTALAPIVAAALAPGAAWAVTVAGDRTVRAWGTGGPSWLNGFAVAIGGQPAAVSVSSSGLLKILSMTDALLELQEYSDVSPSESHFFEMQARVRAAAFSPSGNVAVIACDDGTIRSFDVSTGEFGPVLTTGGQMVQAVAMASDRGPLVAAFSDGSIRHYDIEAGTSNLVVFPFPNHPATIAAADGTVLAAGPHGILIRWRPLSGTPLEFRHTGLAATAIAIAGDSCGDKALIGSADGRLWLYDFVDDRQVEFDRGRQSTSRQPPLPPRQPDYRGILNDDERIPDHQPLARSPEVPGSLSVPRPPDLRSQAADYRSIVDDDVRFTVYRPQVLSPEVWAPLLVFAHKTTLVEKQGQIPIDPNEQVELMARAHFGDLVQPPVASDARSGVFRGARLRIIPDLPGIRSNPVEAEFDWWEPVHQAVFRLSAAPGLAGSVVRGAVRVWCGPLLIGEVSLAIRVTATRPLAEAPLVTEWAQRYRKIFPSYSHDDRTIVEGFAEAARALGDQYLQDVLALRAGEQWGSRLLKLIQEADVFQLFWSSNSMRSRYCRHEWEHALSLRRPSFIRPIYWEDPLPQDPALGLPPVALRELHFVKVRPYLPRTKTPAPALAATTAGPSPRRREQPSSYAPPGGGAWSSAPARPQSPTGAGHPRSSRTSRSGARRRALAVSAVVVVLIVVLAVLVGVHILG